MIALLIIRYFLSLIFLLSAATKLLVPSELFKSLKNYRIIPPRLVKVFGWPLVIVEFALGGVLIAGWQPLISSIVAGVLFLSFIGAGAKVMIKKQVTRCGCFGLLYKEKIGASTIARDVILLFAAVSLAVWGRGLPFIDTVFTGSSLSFFIITVVFLALDIFLLTIVVSKTLAFRVNQRNITRSQHQLKEFAQKV